MKNCLIIRARDFVSHLVGDEDSGCFYFPFQGLDALTASVTGAGKQFGAHPARIEVRDKETALHAHAGMTIALITAGSGVFRDASGECEVRTGDWIIVPPLTPHLSIADAGTVMIEHIVYLGAEDDMQASISV